MSEYDAFAESFAQTRKKRWTDIEELIQRVELNSPKMGSVADIGCGSGRLLDYLNEDNFRDYHGFDISDGLIKIAQREYPGKNFSVVDMCDLGQLGHNFDTLFFVASFQHILRAEEQERIVSDAFHMLSEDGSGRIVLLNWNLTSEKFTKRYPPSQTEPVREITFTGHRRLYYAFGLEELVQLLQNVGFEIVYAGESKTQANTLVIGRRPKR